jgi:hypothetical protein
MHRVAPRPAPAGIDIVAAERRPEGAELQITAAGGLVGQISV